MLFVAIPALRDVFFYDNLNKGADLITGTVLGLKKDAVRESVDYFLVCDLNKNAFFSFSQDMTAEKREEQRKKAVSFPGGVKIRDVYVLGEGEYREGEVKVKMSAVGFAQPALVHLVEGEKVMTIFVEPFLPKVKTAYKDVDISFFLGNFQA